MLPDSDFEIERIETVYALFCRERFLTFEAFLALDWRDLEIWKAHGYGRAVADHERRTSTVSASPPG